MLSASKEVFLRELEAVENSGLYGRLGVVWNDEGQGRIVEADMIGTNDVPVHEILATVDGMGLRDQTSS